MPDFPPALHVLAIISLIVSMVSAIVIVIDELRFPQKMAVMNVVWPLTALFGSVLWLWLYFKWGRSDHDGESPMAVSVFKGASHCGAGCTLGDITAEGAVIAAPVIATWFGYGSLFADRMFAVWAADFLLAFLFGIAFQYFSIAPMRNLSLKDGIIAALKADVASISAWQVGMYGGMALIQFTWFLPRYGGLADATCPEFWLAMQVAMLAGFCTSYPVNWLLVRNGIKEKM